MLKRTFGALPLVAAAAFGMFALAPNAARADSVVVVTPTSMGSWAFDNRDGGGVVIATTGSMVNGPDTPPLGTGSANLVTPGGTGDGASELRNTGFVGVKLSDLSALSYSTYMSNNSPNGQQFPYLGLMISLTGGSTLDDILFFEPPYQTPSTGNSSLPDQGATVMNTWQNWNALTGGWWDNNGVFGPGTGVDSLAAFLALYPDASIVNYNGLGGVRFDVGFASAGDTFDGNVDKFTIGINGNNTTYDFEAAAATPLPAALPLFASGAGVLGYFGWRRKKKAVAA